MGAAFLIDAISAAQLTGLTLLTTGLIVAIVPSVIWLVFFYRRDRREPEPMTLVLEVFVLGALVALGVGIPLLDAYELSEWVNQSPVIHLVATILIVGLLQESLKYVTVRFSVYRSGEFDQLQDGIVYGTAVGLGYATALNLAFVMQSGGADLGPVALRAAIAALAHGSLGGIVGYFLAGQKLRPGESAVGEPDVPELADHRHILLASLGAREFPRSREVLRGGYQARRPH